MILKQDYFSLSNFEGSLDFLLCLIQKDEIDIYDIPIQDIVEQFIRKLSEWEEGQLDKGAEFIGTAAYLVWLKSKMLLPIDEKVEGIEELAEDPHFEIIHHLIDYCRFKQAAKELGHRQDQQQSCYYRGVDVPEWKKPLGIDHISLDELALLFKEMMDRAGESVSQIEEESWRVSDKIQAIRRQLKTEESFPLASLISTHQSRLEIIVIFLAILELMKNGELAVGREQSGILQIYARKEGTSL